MTATDHSAAKLPGEADMRLDTARLALRALEPADAAEVARLAGDRRVAETTALVPSPYTEREAAAWIHGHARGRETGDGFFFALTDKANGALLGSASLDEMADLGPSGRQYDLGYWIAADHWGKGLASEAAVAVRDWAFNVLRAGRLTAYCVHENRASARVLEKAGFVYLNTLAKLRPARGVTALVENFRLDKPRWEAITGAAA